MTTYTCTVKSPLGDIACASENGAITGLWFVGQKYYPSQTKDWIVKPDEPVFLLLREWLGKYFDGDNKLPEIKLSPQGTSFQKTVWEILKKIPRGEIRTYGAIAGEIAARQGIPSMSAQAVGRAVGHNPISIIIPCHRVIGSDGKLTGYAGGLEKKEALLRLEKADLSKIILK